MEEEDVYIRHQSRNTHVIDTADEETQHFFKEKTTLIGYRLSYRANTAEQMDWFVLM